MSTNPAKAILTQLMHALGMGASKDAKDAIKAFLKGTPEELAAAKEVTDDLARVAVGLEAGTVTAEDLEVALDAAKKNARTLLEAKRLRVTRKTLDVFLDAVTFYLRRLLPGE